MSDSNSKKGVSLSTIDFEGEQIQYVIYNGQRVFPVPSVGLLYGYSRDSSLKAFKRNMDFLQGNYYRLKLRLYDPNSDTVSEHERAVSVPCLTGEGIWIYTSRLSVREIPEDRQKKIIRIVQFMAKAAMEVIEQASLQSTTPEKWLEERKKAATNWNRLCDALKIKVVPNIRNPAHERFVYINEAKMLNKNVYGRHQKGIRDRSTLQQIEALENAEAWDTAFLHLNIVDKDKRDDLIDDMLIRHYPDLDLEHVLPEPIQRIRISANSGQKLIIEFCGVA